MLEGKELWLEAAELYEAASSHTVAIVNHDWDIISNGSLAKAHAAEELSKFMRSDKGATALRLLKASSQIIRFGTDRTHSPSTFYVINFQGLIRIENFGRHENIDAREFVEVACDPRIGAKIATDFMDGLYKELTSIARLAPQPALVPV